MGAAAARTRKKKRRENFRFFFLNNTVFFVGRSREDATCRFFSAVDRRNKSNERRRKLKSHREAVKER